LGALASSLIAAEMLENAESRFPHSHPDGDRMSARRIMVDALTESMGGGQAQKPPPNLISA
jgi:hypothetical protein